MTRHNGMGGHSLPERPNLDLHAKLDAQLAAGAHELHLSHDEIDEWRAQFDMTIPVGILAYKGVPIVEVP